MDQQNDLKLIDELTAELYKAICFEVGITMKTGIQ